jgi:hypothetical protein
VDDTPRQGRSGGARRAAAEPGAPNAGIARRLERVAAPSPGSVLRAANTPRKSRPNRRPARGTAPFRRACG